MTTKFRIGYPYANSNSKKIRPALVILKPTKAVRGYSFVTWKGTQYHIADNNGPQILARVPKKGLIGEFFEQEDQRESIIYNGQIHGGGNSMQLALILAIFASYAGEEQYQKAPLLMFSGQIMCPLGAPGFIDAQVESLESPCGDSFLEKSYKNSLYQKYEVSKFACAYGLVLTTSDAQSLVEYLAEKGIKKQISSLNAFKTPPNSDPLIIGVNATGLPTIAREIGISPYHYREKNSKKSINLFLFFLMSIIAIIWMLYGNFDKNPRGQSNYFDENAAKYWINNFPVLIRKRFPYNEDVAIALKQEFGESGRLIYFDKNRKKLWEYIPDYTDDPYYPDRVLIVEYFINGVEIKYNGKPMFLRFVVSHGTWYGRTKVEIFHYQPKENNIGRLLGKFWHKGKMYYLNIKKIDGAEHLLFLADMNAVKWSSSIEDPRYSSAIFCIPLADLLEKKSYITWPGVDSHSPLPTRWLTLFPPSPFVKKSVALNIEQTIKEYSADKKYTTVFLKDSRSYLVNLLDGTSPFPSITSDDQIDHPKYRKGEKYGHLLKVHYAIQDYQKVSDCKIVNKNKHNYALIIREK